MHWSEVRTKLRLRPDQAARLDAHLERYRKAYAGLWTEPVVDGGGRSRLDLLADSMLRAGEFDFGCGRPSFEANLARLEQEGAAKERAPLTSAFDACVGALNRDVHDTLTPYQRLRLWWMRLDPTRLGADGDPLKDALTELMSDKLVNGHSSTFCVLPWMHTFIDVNGDVKLCCEAELTTRKPPNLRGGSFAEIWNSKALIDVRTRMIGGRKSAACRRCHKEDEAGQSSSRQFYNSYWLRNDRDRERWKATIRESLGSGLRVSTPPAYYDIRPGNLCTLKCRMCHSDYSHLIQADPVHGAWAYESPEMRAIREGNGEAWFDAAGGFARELLQNAAGTRRLYLAGGEPLVNPFIAKLIEELVGRSVSQGISLEISTNLTTFPERLLELLTRFEAVQMAVSLDGTDALYEYIRYPGKWPRVSSHVERLAGFPGIEAMITTTVQNYNVLDVEQVFDFALSLGLPCNLNLVYHPAYLTIGVMPQAAKDDARERLRALKERAADTPTARRYPAMLQKLDNVITELTMDTRESYRASVDDFVRFTSDLDRSRGQDFASVCPELFRYLAEDGVRLYSAQ